MTAPAHCNEGFRPTQLSRNDAWSSGKSKRFGLCNILEYAIHVGSKCRTRSYGLLYVKFSY